jgi:hypothetical protein
MPPRRRGSLGQVEVSPTVQYRRDLEKMMAYLVPLPKPELPPVLTDSIPQRFMIYTPPAPPFLSKPESKREGIVHWIKRHWYKELREAKMRELKKGKVKPSVFRRAKWRGTKATGWGMAKAKSSNLEFLNRVAGMQDAADEHAQDVYSKLVSPKEIILVHPSTMQTTEEQLRNEFIGSMLRTRSKAYKDSIIAALLFGPAIVVDTFATPIWPFGGLAEIDAVWFYASARGAKTSRNVTKRLMPSTESAKDVKNSLELTFAPSVDLHVLEQYLAFFLHKHNKKLFPKYVASPSETQLLRAIGWSPSDHGGEKRQFADEQWEITHIKNDLKDVFDKSAKEWCKWCKAYGKKPGKVLDKDQKKGKGWSSAQAGK